MAGSLKVRDLFSMAFTESGINIISFGCSAVLGLAANLIIVFFWGSEGMGIFAQAFAFYIFASQLSIGGVQNATLTYISRRPNKNRAKYILVSSSLITVAGLILVIILLNLTSSSIGEMLESPRVGTAVSALWLSIISGSLNKVFLAALNGLSRFFAFAALQVLRAAFIFFGILLAGFEAVPIEQVPLFFGAGEALAAAIGCFLLRDTFGTVTFKRLRNVVRHEFVFGVRSMPSGALAELNSRVDVLILGFFVSDMIVGIYAFAALLSEGFYNLVLVSRIILSPRIAALLVGRKHHELQRLARKTAIPLTMAAFAALTAIGGVVWIGLSLLPFGIDPGAATVLFMIVSSGIAATASLLPYSTVLMLGGRPGLHSLYFLSVLGVNLVGGLLLTPVFMAYGTAAATAISYLASAAILYGFVLRYFGFKLL